MVVLHVQHSYRAHLSQVNASVGLRREGIGCRLKGQTIPANQPHRELAFSIALELFHSTRKISSIIKVRNRPEIVQTATHNASVLRAKFTRQFATGVEQRLGALV